MGKLILISVLVGTLVVPAAAARDAEARRGFRRLLLYAVLFDVAYAFAVVFVYPRV